MADVRKTGGMTGQTQSITVSARGVEIMVDLSACNYGVALKPDEARFLARKLYRMARLAEQRQSQP